MIDQVCGVNVPAARKQLPNCLSEAMFGSYVLDARPSAEFQYEAAKGKLVNLDPSFDGDKDHKIQFCVPGEELLGNADHIRDYEDQDTKGHRGRLFRLAGSIDFDSRVSVRFLLNLPGDSS